MKRIITTLTLTTLALTVFSQGIIDDSTKWLKNKTESAKTKLADRPTDVNRIIAGNWRDKVQVLVNSNNLNPNLPDKYAYSWIGDIALHIENNGKMSFLIGNGCRYKGDFVTFASDTSWSVEGQFENCPIPTLNRRLIGRIINKNGRIFMTLTQTSVTIDPQVKISIRTTLLTRY